METNTTYEPPPPGEVPPVLDESDIYEDEEDDQAEGAPPPPPDGEPIRRRRGRPPGSGKPRHHKEYGTMAKRFGPDLHQLDLDEWVTRFNWELPRMKMTLRREAPSHFQGVKTAGHLDESSRPFTMAEVKQRFGGGDYLAKVIGPMDEQDIRIRPLAMKRFSISGTPIVDNLESMPTDVQAGLAAGSLTMRPAGGRNLDATKGLLDIVEGEVEMLRQKVHGADGRASEGMQQMRSTYLDAMKVVRDSAESRASAREAAAQEQAQTARDWAQQERVEREKLQEKLATMEREVSERIHSTQGESLALISTLLPNLTNSTNEQVRVLAAQYEAREERLAAQHQASINQLTQVHQIQLQTIQANHEGQIRNLEATHGNNMALLRGQLQSLQSEKEQLQRSLEDARRALDDSRKELLTRIMGEKPKGTMDQIGEMAAMMEAVKTLAGSMGGGGASEDVADGVDNPMVRMAGKLLEKYAPVIENVTSRYRQPQQPMPPMPPQYQQPQFQPPPQQPPPQMMVAPAPPRPAPQPVVPKGQQIKKEDLLEAFTFLDAVLQNPNPPTPEEVAQAAIGKADNGMLHELARRDPEKLMVIFERENLLPGNLAQPAGKEYLLKVLAALRTLLP